MPAYAPGASTSFTPDAGAEATSLSTKLDGSDSLLW